jgi:hypothetical protein
MHEVHAFRSRTLAKSLLAILLLNYARARDLAPSRSGFIHHAAYFRALAFVFLDPHEAAILPISGGVPAFPCIASAGRNKHLMSGV